MWLKIGGGELVRVVALLQQKPLIVERPNEISGIADLKKTMLSIRPRRESTRHLSHLKSESGGDLNKLVLGEHGVEGVLGNATQLCDEALGLSSLGHA
jgi:hypothetical protein